MKDKDVKSKCRNRLCFIPMILVALFLANCQDDEAKMVFDPGIPVQITGFSPDTGGAGTQLVISGRNFGTEKELIKVMVGKPPLSEVTEIIFMPLLLPVRIPDGFMWRLEQKDR